VPQVSPRALAVLLCAAGALTASLLLHYDYGYRVANYTGPPLPLAVTLAAACPVSGHVEIDGALYPLRCGYVIFLPEDAAWPPDPELWGRVKMTWAVLVDDGAAYMLETAPPPGCPEESRWRCSPIIAGHVGLPDGCSYIVFGGKAYALLRAPVMDIYILYADIRDFGGCVVLGVPRDAVRVLPPRACRAGERYRLYQGLWHSRFLGGSALPLYVVGVNVTEARLDRFVGVTAQQSPDAWPLFRPRVAAG